MKIFLKILTGIIIVLLVLWLAFDLIAPSIIKDKIENTISGHPADSVKISSLDIHYFPLGLSISDSYFEIHVTADSVMQQYQLKIHHAKAGGIQWIKAWQDNIWDIGNIEFTDGELSRNLVETDTAINNTPAKPSSKKTELLFRDIDISNFQIKVNQRSSTISLALSAELDSLKIIHTDSLQWDIKRLVLKSDYALLQEVITDYDLAYKNLSYDSDDGLLQITDFKMDPRISRKEFFDKYPTRKVQSKILVPDVLLSGIQLDKINKGLYAHNLILASGDVEIYQDLNKERPDKFKPMPSELIARIPFPIKMDSLRIINSTLKYEHAWKEEKYGLAVLNGDKVDLSFYPISNIGHPESADLKIKGSMRFYEETVLSLNVSCFADKPNHDFEVNAHLSPTNFAVFNPVLYPSSGIKFESGYCEELKAYFYGDDFSTRGDMNMSYKNLQIEIPNNGGIKGLIAEIGEIAGNLTLINKKNSIASTNGKIDYTRNINQPFVNYWWKSLQDGLMDAMITVK